MTQLDLFGDTERSRQWTGHFGEHLTVTQADQHIALVVAEDHSPLTNGVPNGGEQIWLTPAQCRELAAELLARAKRRSP